MTTINKNFEIDKIRILLDLDLPLKIRYQELKVLSGVEQIISVRSKKILFVLIQITRKYISNLYFDSRDKMFIKKVLHKSH